MIAYCQRLNVDFMTPDKIDKVLKFNTFILHSLNYNKVGVNFCCCYGKVKIAFIMWPLSMILTAINLAKNAENDNKYQTF